MDEEKNLEKVDETKKELVEEQESKDIENSDETKKKKGKKEKKKSSLLEKIISWIILIVCVIGLIYSGSQLCKWLLNNINSNKVITEVNDLAGVSDVTDDDDPGADFGIDFEALLASNSDVVGWIKIPGTSISYALVQADDNNKYLRHSFDGTWNEFGWPFVDYTNSSDFSDKNTVIYGHNIVSGLMFADVSYIYNGVLGNDVTIYIYRTDYTMYTYKVFSTYVWDPESYYVTTKFSSDEAYSTFLSTVASRTVRDFNQTVGVDDKIITLSTCTSDSKRRIVVHAKLVSVSEMPR